MKRLVEVEEISQEGLEELLGKKVLLLCANYFYTGKLVDVNTDCVLLENASIVYETGPWTSKSYAEVQRLHTPFWYVQRSAIESFGVSK